MRRIWMDENDNKRIFIDIGEDNEVYHFMVKNSIFVEKTDGDVLTYNVEMFSPSLTARNLKALTDFYKENGWEVSEDVETVTRVYVKTEEERRAYLEDLELKKWFEEHGTPKKTEKPYFAQVIQVMWHRTGSPQYLACFEGWE